MDEIHEGKRTPGEGPQKHPIVNRPESWAQKGCECVGCLRDRELFSYIEHLEKEIEGLKLIVLSHH